MTKAANRSCRGMKDTAHKTLRAGSAEQGNKQIKNV